MKVLVSYYSDGSGFKVLKAYSESEKESDRANEDLKLLQALEDSLSCKVELRDTEL
ncbi:hypothetical protein [Christiangramia forsetii]|uniref:Uncharacterized protein n=2 Tax=Christiangramia forsetii TaxID=411153 RepID=A0M495_CHRFK|nr:hypothetical protein [Christiangramia forsetii]GGG23931.1 hypothetical protein GCM10011532_03940 [Christiangramia forsetii]CAL67440.1 hypothetical protein GFO_2484 [Christiangramia forsetii KT0803]